MKILFASDLHLGKSSWGTYGPDILHKCIDGPEVDVFLFGGDLVEPHVNGVGLADGLTLIQRIPATVKLWVAGNNDIEHLHGKTNHILRDYAPMLQELGQKYGVHLLDNRPVVVEDTAFVGNYGSCDLSLWRTPVVRDDRFPQTIEDLRAQADRSYLKHLGCSVQEMFESCQKTLKSDIEATQGRQKKLVVATHTSPTPDFVFYGHSPGYDHKNAFMGWDDSRTQNPIYIARNLVLQVCGHTHRKETMERPRAPLLNISGDGQPRIVEI